MAILTGTGNSDNLHSGKDDDVIFSGGVGSRYSYANNRYEYVSDGGANQTLTLGSSDDFQKSADKGHAQLIVHGFSIGGGDDSADKLDIGAFLRNDNITAENIGNYLFVVSGSQVDAPNGTVVFINRDGEFSDVDKQYLANDVYGAKFDQAHNADLFIDFRGRAETNNFEEITGEGDNTVEQFQSLINSGFLDLSRPFSDESVIRGTDEADVLEGTGGDEDFISGGLTQGVESIRGNGGSDRLVLDSDATYAVDSADDTNGHFRIRDFIIDDLETNEQADVLDIVGFLQEANPGIVFDASNVGNYLHVVSGLYGYGVNRTGIFINREGDFTKADRTALESDVANGGHRADLFLEFQGQASNNNFETITGKADNTVEQFQALIDLGFLDLSTIDPDSSVSGSSNPGFNDISNQDVSGKDISADSIRSNGGSDRLVLNRDDSYVTDNAGSRTGGHLRVRDFVIDDIQSNAEADVFDIADFLNGIDFNAINIGDYLHVVSGLYGEDRTGVFVNKNGDFTATDHTELNLDPITGGHGADLLVEFQGKDKSSSNNFSTLTGETDNTVEQFQALIDLGFLDLSGNREVIEGTTNADVLEGTAADEDIISLGLSRGIEVVESNGGADRLIIGANAADANNSADDSNGHFRIRDFVIDDVRQNQQADAVDLSDFLPASEVNASNIGNYLHVVSGLYGYGTQRSGIFINREGDFTDEDHASLTADVAVGGHGADLFLEFQGLESNNNFEVLTGKADNTVEQYQALIDLGFLDLGDVDLSPTVLFENYTRLDGSAGGDDLVGSSKDELFVIGGASDRSDSVRGNGGSDRILLAREDSHADGEAGSRTGGHVRVRDFTIGDVASNSEADILDLGDFLPITALDVNTLGNYLHIVSGIYGTDRSAILVNKDGDFTAADHQTLSENDDYAGGYGADLYIEFITGAATNHLENITGHADNTIEQFQALIDLGFLALTPSLDSKPTVGNSAPAEFLGTPTGDDFVGSEADNIFYSGGVSGSQAESVRGNGGSDRLILDADDPSFTDEAGSRTGGHIRIRDFTIADTVVDQEADVVDISEFLNADYISAANLGDYLHVISGLFGTDRTGIFIDRDGGFDASDHANLSLNPLGGGRGADLLLEFQGQLDGNNIAEITGYADNTVEQFQALLDLGFLDVGEISLPPVIDPFAEYERIEGSAGGDNLIGTSEDELFVVGGASDRADSVRGNGGSDRILLASEDSHADGKAGSRTGGHIRVRDFTIGDVAINSEADVLDLGDFLPINTLDVNTIGNYLHIVSGIYGTDRSAVLINKDGDFTTADHQALNDNDDYAGGHGADLFIEFISGAATNHLEDITGHADNTIEQFQALIDLGFLALTPSSDTAPVPEVPSEPVEHIGTDFGDNFVGSDLDDIFYSGGVDRQAVDDVRGNGGSDRLVLDADDAYIPGGVDINRGADIRISDFTIGDTATNSEADTLDIASFLNNSGFDATNIGNYVGIVSGVHGNDGSAIFISKNGDFSQSYGRELSFFFHSFGAVGGDLYLELEGGVENNIAAVTGYADNTVEQFQALIDMGFLDLSNVRGDFDGPIRISGTDRSDELIGTFADEHFYSAGAIDSAGLDVIQGNGGADRLVLNSDDSERGFSSISIQDFTIGDTSVDLTADTLDVGSFLFGHVSYYAAESIGDYLHIVSGLDGRGGIFIDRSGGFDLSDKEFLSANPEVRGADARGADLYLGFPERTGLDAYADNTVEQYQALIDLGFLDLSRSSDDQFPSHSPINGDGVIDDLVGSSADEVFVLSTALEQEVSVVSGGGSDVLSLGNSGLLNVASLPFDSTAMRVSVKDFVIGDVRTNANADVLDLGFATFDSHINPNLYRSVHIISGIDGTNGSGIYISRLPEFTDELHAALDNAADPYAGGHAADIFIEFAASDGVNNNIEAITGYADNTVEQYQALIDLGFFTISFGEGLFDRSQQVNPVEHIGTSNGDSLIGSFADDIFYSGGVKNNVIESIRSNGGVDKLVLNADDAIARDSAGNNAGHIRVHDFTIGDDGVSENADVLSLGDFFSGPNTTLDELLGHIHVVSGLYGERGTGVFLNQDRAFTAQERAALDADPLAGGHGADLLVEFEGQVAQNNFETITGESDNTVGQLQALLDLGFLDLPETEIQREAIIGTPFGDSLRGTEADEDFFSGGVNNFSANQSLASESIQGNVQPIIDENGQFIPFEQAVFSGGSDRLILNADDAVIRDQAGTSRGHIRIIDFIIDDTEVNDQADVLAFTDFFGDSVSSLDDLLGHLHVVSDPDSLKTTSVFLNQDREFTSAEREALTADIVSGNDAVGNGADLLLEFRNSFGEGNNFAELTGETDNTLAQLQSLVDIGFIEY